MIIKAILNTLVFGFIMAGFFLAHTIMLVLFAGGETENVHRGALVLMLILSFVDAFLLMVAFYKWG